MSDRLHIALVFLTCVIAGCQSKDSQRVPAKGTVTFHGKPVSYGSIAWRPLANTRGPAAGTDIADGRYDIPQRFGPGTGSYLVRITIVDLNEDGPARPFGHNGGDSDSFEVRVTVSADRVHYHFSLPQTDDSRHGGFFICRPRLHA